MSWMVPAAKTAAKYGAKYGPHARVAWQAFGKQAQAAARAKVDELALRRRAFDQADATVGGSVLRLVHEGKPVYVVFSEEHPIDSHPPVGRPLADLVRTADLGKRQTPAELRERQLRARVQRAGVTVRRTRKPKT